MSKDYYQVIYEDDSKARFLGKIIDKPGKIIKAQKKLTPGELKKIPTLNANNQIVMIEKIITIDQKKANLKIIRNSLILSTMWIQQRHFSEEYGLNKGWTINAPTLIDKDYKEWILYWEKLRDLPETVDLSNINIEDINIGNNKIFPKMPDVVRSNLNEKKDKKYVK